MSIPDLTSNASTSNASTSYSHMIHRTNEARVQSESNYSIFSLKGICVMLVISVVISNVLITRHELLTSLYFQPNKLKYAIYLGPGLTNSLIGENPLAHLKNVLERMGYQKVNYEYDWDLLWAHVYPFGELNKNRLMNLNHSQRINHFPGSGFLTHKAQLCTSDIKYLPKSFRLPNQKEEFLLYHKNNPQVLFVEKSNDHRNIFIKPAGEIDLNSTKTFVQEYIEDPYLVDGYKFDIGVYVIITSLNPLRVYIYTGDYAFRFCAEKYDPFDPKNVNKYVVGDNYIPMWKIPSLKTYFNTFKFNFKDSFDAYVRLQKQEPQIIWDQMEEIIRYTILSQEKKLLRANGNYSFRQFFELMRFDLIVTKDLKVYLMEANMSPNLSSGYYKQNAVYFEQIIYNVLELLGIGSSTKRESFQAQSKNSELMISSDKNIATNANKCLENLCNENCNNSSCNLCLNCMNKDDLKVLHETFREHIRRAGTKRIFPKPITNLKEYDVKSELEGLSPSNQMITKWFYEKCIVDPTWCT